MSTQNIVIVIIVAVLVIGGILFFMRGGSSPSNNNPPTAPPVTNQYQPTTPTTNDNTVAVPASGVTNENTNTNSNSNANQVTASSVTIKNFAFSPAQLTVKAGTTVKWTNQDPTSHTIASDNNTFNSGNIATGGSFEFTFKTAGTYTYHCGIHPNMTGTITVQ